MSTIPLSEDNSSLIKRGSPTYSFRTDSVSNMSPSISPCLKHNLTTNKDSLVIKLKRPNDLRHKQTRRKHTESINREVVTPINEGVKRSISNVPRNAETHIDKYDTLYKKEFQFGEDGTLYYNPKQTQQFLLACPAKKEENEPKVNQSAMLQATNPEIVQVTSDTAPKRKGPEDCKNMKAVGTTLMMSKRKVRSYKQATRQLKQRSDICHQVLAGECNCKRFSQKWQRMTAIILENNKAVKVQSRINESPVNEVASNSNAFIKKESKTETKTIYKSYLKRKYKDKLNKNEMKSEYSIKKMPEENAYTDDSFEFEVDLTKAQEKRKKRVEVNSMKKELGYKSPDEIVHKLQEMQQKLREEEKLKRIREHIEKPDLKIADLETKYDAFYRQVGGLKKPARNISQLAKPAPLFKRFVEEVRKAKPKELKTVADKKRTNTYITEVLNNVQDFAPENYGVNDISDLEYRAENKIHLGNEDFPEIIKSKFSLHKPTSLEEFRSIENLVQTRWQTFCKVKIYKDCKMEVYYAIPYGKRCILSNCCNSLTMVKIAKDEGCKLFCMNKACLTKILEWFSLPLENAGILFPTEALESLPLTNGDLRLRYQNKTGRKAKTGIASRRLKNIKIPKILNETYKLPFYENNQTESGVSTVLTGEMNQKGIGLIIEKRQRMPLAKMRDLSLIVK